jgi:hypothetical protein
MRIGKGASIVIVAFTIGVAGPARADVGHSVRVRVYDRAGLDAPTKALALRTAADALATASVLIAWEPCETPDACRSPLSNERVIRIVRTGTAGSALGDALVDMTTGSAVFATIYFQRVHLLARSAGTSDAVVLGYAIAHELGHLLLASHQHSESGLMRAAWGERDLRRARTDDWRFSAPDAAAIHDRLEAARTSSDTIWTTR